jgi:hypothetical protein
VSFVFELDRTLRFKRNLPQRQFDAEYVAITSVGLARVLARCSLSKRYATPPGTVFIRKAALWTGPQLEFAGIAIMRVQQVAEMLMV